MQPRGRSRVLDRGYRGGLLLGGPGLQLLEENAEKIKESVKGPIQSAIEKLKQKASGEDAAAIKQALDELMQVKWKSKTN